MRSSRIWRHRRRKAWPSWKTKFADAFGAAGLSGKETAVIYEQSMNSGFGQSCRGYYLLTMLGYPKIQGAARRLRRLGRWRASDDEGRSEPGKKPRSPSCRRPATS